METCVSAGWNSFPGVMWSLHRHRGEEYTGEISVVGEPLISCLGGKTGCSQAAVLWDGARMKR